MPSDFYESILAVLEAPHWHGTNVNALIDSMLYGGINGIDPPYRIWIKGTANLPVAVKTELGWLAEAIDNQGGPEKGVTIQIDP
jgi:hypothetical protein